MWHSLTRSVKSVKLVNVVNPVKLVNAVNVNDVCVNDVVRQHDSSQVGQPSQVNVVVRQGISEKRCAATVFGL